MTDPSQELRFGTYQVRNGSKLHEAGIFCDHAAVTKHEFDTITTYAKNHGLALLDRETFVNMVLYRYGYEVRGTIVGFNLPFDISRIAIKHAPARTDMRGGFSFTLSCDKRNPAIQIKHLSQKASLIRYAAPFPNRSRESAPIRRGFFVDVSTLATALFARRFSLDALSNFLGVEHPKLLAEEHGGPITADYVQYAVRDVQTTFECYAELIRRYEALKLADTAPSKIYSEASLGKAYLKAMNIQPWLKVQPNVPAAVLAMIMGSYVGGRSEVRIRRELRQVVLCDFLSMYPTVCTLMGLWRFVIAEGMTWRDTTKETMRFLDCVTLDDLKSPETWKNMATIVRVQPDWDIFPVRASYDDGGGPATIAANYLKADRPLYFTLADCIASKLLTGKVPKIVEAFTFEPGKPQADLRPVAISGNPEYQINPVHDDFYRRLIELRHEVKRKRDHAAAPSEQVALDTGQNALKIAANATSYGIFVEVNVKAQADPESIMIHSAAGRSYSVDTDKVEEPGRYFHPLLATLITGAARLMLAITERLVDDRCLEWAFCDTDSMAIATPDGMGVGEFYSSVDRIVEWFSHLNPYSFGGTILKVEDQNFSIADRKVRESLFCWAVSAKRYALFNIDAQGQPILRKASAHGLGHLRAPYDDANPARDIPPPKVTLEKMGVELWQHDLWWKIVTAALAGNPDRVGHNYHPALSGPAISRYGATTPKLLRWFDQFNDGLSYAEQIKPFGFLLSLFANGLTNEGESFDDVTARKRKTQPCSRAACKPVAPYDLARAIEKAFDRETGDPISADALKSYKQVIAGYHLHPEAKFSNGDAFDRGVTRRRYVYAIAFRNIGKEANEWEEQFYLGYDEEEQIEYGLGPQDARSFVEALRTGIETMGQREVARVSGVSRRTIARLMEGEPIRGKIVAKIVRALKRERP
jgi:hypothetical protein